MVVHPTRHFHVELQGTGTVKHRQVEGPVCDFCEFYITYKNGGNTVQKEAACTEKLY